MKTLLSWIGRILYFSIGWTYDPLPEYWDKKSVVIGFPHTKNMDTFRALTYIKIAKVNARLLVKASWFFFPMSLLLKGLGGLPVERDKASGFVGSVVAEFNKRDELVLALVPEGTRKQVTTIKTGFWHIAKGANVPIICWYLDNRAKRTRWIGRIDPGESLESDLLKIKALYEQAGFSIPLKEIKKPESPA
ncbi:MAG: acyl-phosphate glycerol 3-phosphate acyltransferase [Proteobacteria bacterium]|nr:acyl-phosphate glycerol 3-phosphate acyltransferase [Desulfobacula sp.]MBU3953231.1 acyl-phosphate glycerol 3-phosphate acyltransferase [Pseudomonadota bacterium]MBU4129677.1 acyl-phosphate glycerol 3-phosphate acyltransferase [Pseudomonadota bacterium]